MLLCLAAHAHCVKRWFLLLLWENQKDLNCTPCGMLHMGRSTNIFLPISPQTFEKWTTSGIVPSRFFLLEQSSEFSNEFKSGNLDAYGTEPPCPSKGSYWMRGAAFLGGQTSYFLTIVFVIHSPDRIIDLCFDSTFESILLKLFVDLGM